MEIRVKAFAKLNISLDVVGRLESGYHAMRMVMESVALCDDIRIECQPGEGIAVRTNLSYLPSDDRNIAAAAARLFLRETGISGKGLAVDIHKRIPVCAGMAGGSSDAAAVLRGLNSMLRTGLSRSDLELMGARLGSDVPYCVAGGTALAEERGERLTPLPAMPGCHIVICKPKFPVSTPKLFSRLDMGKIRNRPDTAGIIKGLETGNLREIARRMYNVFEDVLCQEKEDVQMIKSTLLHYEALGAVMSGTGPAVFGVFDDPQKARKAFAALRSVYKDCFLTKNIGTLDV